MRLSGARVTVVGMGQSGLAAARLLVARGAKVTINDARTAAAIGSAVGEATELGAALALGGHDAVRLAQSDLVVVSPGVPRLAELATVEQAGIPVIGEVELAARLLEGAMVIGVTGTNGKSTVTTLIGEMCQASGRPTFVGGNLGRPLSEVVGTPAARTGGFVVVELSSFQLERVVEFRAQIGVLLNITDDHLDRYASLAEYAEAKGRLFATQHASDVAIAPSENQLCLSIVRMSPGRQATFGGAGGSVRRDGGLLVDTESGLSLPLDELGIRGEHNIENACAAALAAREAGVARDVIEKVLRSFTGLPHRMQHVATLGGIAFYDDSKATNVGAAVAAIAAFARQKVKVVLIAGGKDKGGSYAPLREELERHGAGLVLLGEAGPLIAQAFAGTQLPVVTTESMDEAVRAAHQLSRWGEAVLLAPACASFDMFRSYGHRGDVFAEAVLTLQKELGA